MFDAPIPLHRSRFRLRSEDPELVVRWLGGARFSLSGEVSLDPDAALDLTTPSVGEVEVTLARHSQPEHAVAALRRALPRQVVLTERPVVDGVEVLLHEALVPAARPPRLRLFSTDLSQRVRQIEENKVEFLGATGAPCHLTIVCDTRRVTIALDAGSSAQATATRVGANVPQGYRALVDGAIVSVWKDADFFSMVA
jgi:hypothetical protein